MPDPDFQQSQHESRYLKIYPGVYLNASRDDREMDVAQNLGLQVSLLSKAPSADATVAVDGGYQSVQRVCLSTRPFGQRRALLHLNRSASLLTWAMRARSMRPSIISGHNIHGLFIGWLSTLFLPRQQRPYLVYDAHEYEIARNVPRGPIALLVIRQLERFLIRRCAFSIMVNEGIASRVQKLHNLPARPVVVRSTPSLWAHSDEIKSARRAEFLAEIDVPSVSFLMMYHGGVVPDRGIEMSLRVLQGRNSVALIVLGNGSDEYLARLQYLAQRLGVAERVLFKPAVPLEVLGEYVGAADVGMVILPAVTENQYLTLPNKFFENIQSGTPVIASDFPEVGALVRQYEVGTLVDPESLDAVGSVVDTMQNQSWPNEGVREKLELAKIDLCWEKEQTKLSNAFQPLLGER